MNEFIRILSDDEAAAVVAAMKDVARRGLVAARHVRRDIYEVRAFTETRDFRLLFAPIGKKGRILLALEVYSKKTQKTPDRLIKLAEQRLDDWQKRGAKTR